MALGSVTQLRQARLHACEAVRLLRAASEPGKAGSERADDSAASAQAWALSVLADVCYAHWSASANAKRQPRLTWHKLRTLDALVQSCKEPSTTRAGDGAAAADAAAPATPQQATADDSDASLHRLARTQLCALAASLVSSREQEAAADCGVFPLAAVGRACLSPAALDRLREQAQAMGEASL